MNYLDIPAFEAAFRATGIASRTRHFKLNAANVPVPGSKDQLKVVLANATDGTESFYYPQVAPKQRIALHFTAGYLKGDMHQLSLPDNHVSTPFVIARDGTIYQLFSSKYWSYHLGKGAAGGNEPMSRGSVAIELSNVGPLKLRNSTLFDPYGSEYCKECDSSAYVKLPSPYRGYTYFATFTAQQYSSLKVLLQYLSTTYSIPLKLLPEKQRYDVYPAVASWRGITSHVNYQPASYGKWDIGPAFAWDRIGAS
jgi:N-acetylmuramoyl-L-alanine amidase